MKKDSLSLFFLILIFALTINFKTNTVAEGWADTKEFGPFLCYSQFSLDSIQNELHELHELQNRICSQLHLPAPKQQIELYFFKDAASWTAWHKQHLPDTPLRRALFIKPDVIIQSDKTRAQVFTYYSPQLAQDLRHEGTHAILHTIVGKPIPIWLDEGLAEYYEQDEKIPAVAKARVQHQTIRPLKKLEKIQTMGSMTADAYADAWAWTVYLLEGPQNLRHILPEYIRDFQKKLFYSSISSRVGKVHKNPDAALAQFINAMALPEESDMTDSFPPISSQSVPDVHSMPRPSAVPSQPSAPPSAQPAKRPRTLPIFMPR